MTAPSTSTRLGAAEGGTPAAVSTILSSLDSFLRGARSWERIVAERAALLARAVGLADLRGAASGPLRVLLVGGTGAGKSTLLNALAGADIARVSAARPTTREFTCWHHRETRLDTLGPAVLAGAVPRPHEREALRDKIVVDAPDFDSAVRENRDLLAQALEVADLVVTVATTEKYLTRELFALLAARRVGREFVFVFNKVDQLDTADLPRVLEDLRGELSAAGFSGARVLALSARNALRNGMGADSGGPPAPEGEFPQLRRILEEELDRARIRAIKSRNLSAHLEALLGRIAELLPADPVAAVAAWEADCAAAQGDLLDDLSRRLLAGLEADREVRNLASLTLGSSFSFLYGVASSLAYALRAAVRPDYARLRGTGREAARELLRGKGGSAAAAAEQADLTLRAHVHAGARRGLARAGLEEALAPARRPEALATLLESVEERLAERLTEAFRAAASGRRQWIADMALNAPPGAFSAYVVGRLVVDYAQGTTIPVLNFLGASGALLAALLAVEFYAAERLYVSRAADRCFAAVAGFLRGEAEAGVGSRLLEGVRAAADAARAEAAEVARLRAAAAGLRAETA